MFTSPLKLGVESLIFPYPDLTNSFSLDVTEHRMTESISTTGLNWNTYLPLLNVPV